MNSDFCSAALFVTWVYCVVCQHQEELAVAISPMGLGIEIGSTSPTSDRLAVLVLAIWVGLAIAAGTARADSANATSPAQSNLVNQAQTLSLTVEEKLIADFTDPLTTLPQVSLKDAFTPANFGTHVQTNALILRPIIPRVPRFSLLPLIQLIRPTFSLVTVPSARGGTRTEFGDMQFLDLAVPPWPSRETGFAIGVGPTFVLPTATSRSAGQGAWQAGPAIGAVYKGIPWLVTGFILQNPISFAYTSRKRPPQNTLEFQPALAIHLWEGWYLRSAEATWTCGWHHHSATVLPLSLGIGDVIVRPGLPPLNFYVTGQWTVYRQFAPIAPQTGVNFGLIVAFPDYKPW